MFALINTKTINRKRSLITSYYHQKIINNSLHVEDKDMTLR